jgi:hypothetical protein
VTVIVPVNHNGIGVIEEICMMQFNANLSQYPERLVMNGG